jgi:hypothetical protein
MSEEGIANDGGSSSNTENILVSITVHDANIQFRGSLESVYKSTIDFIVKQFPDIDIAKQISLNYSVDYLVKKYSNLIRVFPDKGTQVLIQPDRLEEEEEADTTIYKAEELDKHKNEEKLQEPKSVHGSSDSTSLERRKKWSLKQIIALHLVASRIANGLGISQYEGLQIYEIEYATQANSKSINSRLSEMIKSGYVIKDLRFDSTSGIGGEEEEKPSTIYTITTTGIHWLNHIIDSKAEKE